MVSFYELGSKKLLRKHAAQAEKLKEQIVRMLESQAQAGFAKVKPATHLLFDEQKVWELRVNPAQLPPVRVAFTRAADQFLVVYMSHTLQKSEFSRELEHFLKQRKEHS